MATVFLIDGATNATTAGNWNTAKDGSGSSGAPAAGDTAILAFDNHITAGHDGMDVGTNGLAEVLISGNVTSAGAAAGLTIDCHLTATSAIRCENNTALTLTSGTANVENLILSAPGGQWTLAGGTFDDVFLESGRLIIGASAVVTGLTMTGGECYAFDGTAFTALRVLGGRCSTERDVTTLTADGSSAAFTLSSSVVTTANLQGSALFNHRSGTDITTLNQYSPNSTFSPYGASNSFTVTTANRYAGSFGAKSGGVTVTIDTDSITETPTTIEMNTINIHAPAGPFV